MLKPVHTCSKMLFLQVNDLLDRSLIRNQSFRVHSADFDIKKAIVEIIDIEENNAGLRKNTIVLQISKNVP